MPWGQLNWLKQASSGVARKFFNAPTSFVGGNSPVPGLAATPIPVFGSLHDYIHSGDTMIGSQFPWVCYDIENWAQTPEIEKRHVKLALSVFADLAHGRGQKVLAAPSRDIIYAKACDEPWQYPETIDAGYLRVGIPLACRDAEVFLCQSQGDEKNLTAFAQLLAAADKQTSPDQVLWGGLTTNFATGAQMKAAYDAANTAGANVAGWWVTVASQAQAQVAVDFFNLL
jgi:hypothetical protein